MTAIITDPAALIGQSPFDLGVLVARVQAAGVGAFVRYSGNGYATVYAGGEHTDPADGCRYWSAVAGPGRYSSTTDTASAVLDDFWVGEDREGAGASARNLGARTINDLANLIVRQASGEDDEPSDDDTCAVCGASIDDTVNGETAAHYAGPFSSVIVAWTCSGACTTTFEKTQ